MARADVHAARRARSAQEGADLNALIKLLDGHKLTLNAVLAWEAAAVDQGADTVTRSNLNALGNRARKFLSRIEKTLDLPVLGCSHDDLGRWGRNGHAPTIADMLSSAQYHAHYGGVVLSRKVAA